jgi:hypothetical protein
VTAPTTRTTGQSILRATVHRGGGLPPVSRSARGLAGAWSGVAAAARQSHLHAPSDQRDRSFGWTGQPVCLRVKYQTAGGRLQPMGRPSRAAHRPGRAKRVLLESQRSGGDAAEPAPFRGQRVADTIHADSLAVSHESQHTARTAVCPPCGPEGERCTPLGSPRGRLERKRGDVPGDDPAG